MPNILQILTSTFIFTLNALCEESFFMNEDQSKMIIDLLQNREKKQTKTTESHMELTGIFYIDEENWTIWIDNKQYSSIGENDLFAIDSVSENCVTITLPEGNTLNLSIANDLDENKEKTT